MALGAVVLMTVPWPAAARAPAFVEYAPPVVIRADSAGFVHDVLVRGGQVVEEGQVLAVLGNDELTAQLADLELRIEQSKIRSRQHQKKQEMAAFQAEAAVREALEKQRDEVRIQVQQLTVRAPESGNVIGWRLEALRGVYLEEGDKLLEIGSDDRKEIRVSIAQDDLDRFQGQVGRPVDVSLPGHDSLACTLTKISPRATLEPENVALCAPLGGPLTVCRKEVSADAESNTHYEFLAPRFTGFVQLDATQSKRLHAGQTGAVSFGDRKQAIGPHLYHLLTRWVQRRLQRSG
jgi:multidrug resistance efflux pump